MEPNTVTTDPITPAPIPNDKQSNQSDDFIAQIMNEGVSIQVVLLTLLVVAVCACICCGIYVKRVHSKIAHVTYDREARDSDSSSKDVHCEATAQKLAPGSYKTTHSPSKPITNTNHSLSSTMYGPTGDLVLDYKKKPHPEKKGALSVSPSTIFIQHTSPRASKQDAKKNVTFSASPSTVFIQHASPRASKQNARRRTSSNRLEVGTRTKTKSAFDSPSFVIASRPSKSTNIVNDDSTMLIPSQLGMDDMEHSLIALDGSVNSGKTYASEGIITRTTTDELVKLAMDVNHPMYHDDEKAGSLNEDRSNVLEFESDQQVKMRLESDEFIIRSDSTFETKQ